MTELNLYVLKDTENKENIISRLDEIGLNYNVVTVSEDEADRNKVESITGQREVPVLSGLDDRQYIQGSEEIINYLNENYQSKSWRRKEKISDVVYHILDGILEFF